ncbi:hypothetical protein IKK_05586 [Bacillus mycoides]|jgi:hypothetical protein|uniref:Uncharacterized protein n=1 Tax=Bacillus mycoides TaxID=1405 RepID=A0AAP8GTM9_BACMY|nr:hypothetical protein IKM_05453 [Bacillus mycoides]EJR98548.1 hypothetical protein IKO_05448 [Bacillus cereus VDM034]EJS11514.1 hypothetical protein IKS_05402 [Bacillus cereus VDM062]EOO34548.1 hypothetical protein IKK_05586 [Bacillus mycoides]PJN58439.1 hypothetical protein BAWEI_50670 [Bacillus mycoides]
MLVEPAHQHTGILSMLDFEMFGYRWVNEKDLPVARVLIY